jgi:hypothetical protein
MKNLMMIIFLALASINLFALDQEKEPKGFRGIEWGTDLSKNKEFILLDGDEGLKRYNRINDKMKIGEIKVGNIYYITYKDKFYSVVILSNDKYLKTTFEETYGIPYQPNQFIEKFEWYFDNVIIKSYVNMYSGIITIDYFYMPIVNEYFSDKRQKASEGKKDL